ncbi:DNA recombination protein RmuC [Candidatus Parcubacteria bacterium]|nr:DNA recombination protein RmuC [Candidatus Parcubacteria bacterium]
METLLYALGGLIIGGIAAFFAFRKPSSEAPDQAFVLLQNQMENLTKALESKLGESGREMRDAVRTQFSESQRLIKDITRELTEVKETGKQVAQVAEELGQLQDILKNPKQRGILGEYYLETLLKNVMPPGSYEMQHRLGKNDDGEELIPDAVVFVRKKIIPVDSKFSLENYNRMVETRDPAEKERFAKVFENDLKNRIVETSKYIQPAKGTMDFAFMFIPHEAIYYDLLVGKVGKDTEENLIQRAASKYKVIIVSPTSFLAYLQTVLQGLKALEIEDKVQDVIRRVGDLMKHLSAYESYHNKVGNALGTAVNQWTFASRELKKVDKDILKITGTSANIETPVLERPRVAEEI